MIFHSDPYTVLVLWTVTKISTSSLEPILKERNTLQVENWGVFFMYSGDRTEAILTNRLLHARLTSVGTTLVSKNRKYPFVHLPETLNRSVYG